MKRITALFAFAALIGFASPSVAQAPPVSPSLPGCFYTASPSTLVDGEIGYILCDSSHRIQTVGGAVPGGASGTVQYNNAGAFGGITGSAYSAPSLILGATTLQLGPTDAAAPSATTFKAQSVIAGTANTAAPNLTIAAPVSTGSAAGGSIIFQTAAAGGAGSTQNALLAALTLNSAGDGIFNGAVTPGQGSALSGGGPAFRRRGDGIAIIVSRGDDPGTPYAFTAGDLQATSNSRIGFLNSTSPNTSTMDTILVRDAANILALRNSTAAQTLRVYGSYTDAANNYGLSFASSGGVAQIQDFNNGTGGSSEIYINAAGTNTISLANGGVRKWQVNASGHFVAPTDNTYDIGASGATRPRNIYVGTQVYAGTVRVAQTTVAGLPAAATAGMGAAAYVTDAVACTFLTAVTGGGAAKCPVVSDGTNWVGG